MRSEADIKKRIEDLKKLREELNKIARIHQLHETFKPLYYAISSEIGTLEDVLESEHEA